MAKIIDKEKELSIILDMWSQMADKYTKKAVKDLNKISRLAVWRWYKTYSPKYYHRRRTLYYAFDITENNGVIRIHFGNEKMYRCHFVDKYDANYIFFNSFEEGYHGGARDGEDHPNPGVPYWRTPYPTFDRWSYPARQDYSPYNLIVDDVKEYEEKTRAQIFKEFKRRIMPRLVRVLYQ